MARLRTLKPSFFANEELATLPFSGRLLFAGLWTIADRRGRLEDRPTRIKAQIYPYDDVATDELLDGLAQMGFIQRYDVEGLHYIQVVNFEKHQNPHLREAESTIPPPAPTKAVPSTVLSTTKAVTSPAVLRSPFSVLRSPGIGDLGVDTRLAPGQPEAPTPDEPPDVAETGPRASRRGAPTRVKKVTDAFLSKIEDDYGPRLGGVHRVRDAIADAMAHKNLSRWNDQERYVINWLNREAARYEGGGSSRNGSGIAKHDPASRGDLASVRSQR